MPTINAMRVALSTTERVVAMAQKDGVEGALGFMSMDLAQVEAIRKAARRPCT